MYKKYAYGSRKKEVKGLLWDRLKIREKIRYYTVKIKEYAAKEKEITESINQLLEFSK